MGPIRFEVVTASFLAAVTVAALAMVVNLIPSDKMVYYLFGVAIFVASAGAVAYILNVSAVHYAETTLKCLSNQCENTLRHVQSEYTSSILRGAIIHDSELDALERSVETQEVWVITPLNLEYDVPGKVFFNSLKENLDIHKKKYTYIIQDSEKARYNARQIAEEIENKSNLRFVLLDDKEWNSLPIVGIPVTIHNPSQVAKLRIYISTQQSRDRGQHWAVFSGWTTGQIIERARMIVNGAKNVKTLVDYASA